jgi:predicted RNase H-like HicB family nuclease
VPAAFAAYDASVAAKPPLKLSTIDHIRMSTQRQRLTPVFEDAGDGWFMARIAEIPAVITQGHGIEDARSMLDDALREYLAFLVDEGRPLPDGVSADAQI